MNDVPLRSDTQTLAYLFDIIREGVWDWNANTGHVSRSPGWYRMLGYDVGCFAENVFTWENIIHPDDYPRVMTAFERYIRGEAEQYQIEYRCRCHNGDYLWVADQGKIVECNSDGSVARMIGAHLNIHDQKLAQEELLRRNRLLSANNENLEALVRLRTLELEETNKRLEAQIERSRLDANTDPLTQLDNRRKFESELEREISRALRYSAPLCIAMVDLDYFKRVNDTHGHATGDHALLQVAGVIRRELRASDRAARWGGEEFALILPETSRQQMATIAEKLRLAVANAMAELQLPVTCSIGISEFQRDDNADSLLKRVDAALYTAKNAGRNRTRCVDDGQLSDIES